MYIPYKQLKQNVNSSYPAWAINKTSNHLSTRESIIRISKIVLICNGFYLIVKIFIPMCIKFINNCYFCGFLVDKERKSTRLNYSHVSNLFAIIFFIIIRII